MHRELVLFGGLGAGFLDDTWTWDGEAWHLGEPPAASPTGRYFHAAATAPAVGGVLLFGGADAGGPLGETWAWNGDTWTELALPATPPESGFAAAMAHDPVGDAVVRVGGAGANQTSSATTWRFKSGGWSELVAATPSVVGASLLYDVAAGAHAARRPASELDKPYVWDGGMGGDRRAPTGALTTSPSRTTPCTGSSSWCSARTCGRGTGRAGR
ncbi:MAG: hypothetical protein R2939_12300 [Kofleriaceae bacterium]